MTQHDTFGARVRRERERQQISRGALAKAVGCAEGTIARIESGRTLVPRIRLDRALAISSELHVTVEWLAFGPGGGSLHDRLTALERYVNATSEQNDG